MRTRRSALWAGYGDALGFISELTDRAGLLRRTEGVELRAPMAWKRRVGGRSGVSVVLPAGCYSDDTQLRLSTARAIGSAGFDVEAFAKVELPVWSAYALGGGVSTKAAASSLARATTPWFANSYKGWLSAGGNGAAMRIQPHVWAALDLDDPASYLADVLRNTVCTHGHPTGIMGAVLHALTVGFTLRSGKVPTGSDMLRLAESTLEVPDLIRGQPELDELWLVAWQRGSSGRFEVAWSETYAETRRLLEVAIANDTSGPIGYEWLISQFGLRDKGKRGSGILTTIAAVALAWYAPQVANALTLAANAIGTDTDTIATMTGAILGATATDDPPGDLLDAELIRSEADRLTQLGGGGSTSGHSYPDLLHWSPPKSQADALLELGGELYVAGLGLVSETLGEPIVGPSHDFLWQWAQLSFGQTVLIKRRRKLASAGLADMPFRRVEQVSIPGLEDSLELGTPRLRLTSDANRRPARASDEGKRVPATAETDSGSGSLQVRVAPAAEGIVVERVLEYLEREMMANDAVGYAMRRIAHEATAQQTESFMNVLLTRLRAYPSPSLPVRGRVNPSARSADVGAPTRVARMTRDFEWLRTRIGHLVFTSLDDPECYVQFARDDTSGHLWMEVSSGNYQRPRTLKLSREARAHLVELGLDRPRRAKNPTKNFAREIQGTSAELAQTTEAIFHDVFGLPEVFPLQVLYSE